MEHTIYALYDAKDFEYFYVGRTERALLIRMNEHRRDYKTGTEHKYQYMRELEAKGINWRVDILAVVKEGDKKFEDYYVYKLLCEGHPLKNQKMGDSIESANWDAMARMRSAKQRYSSPQAFLTAREREVQEAAARAATAKLHAKVQREELTGDIDPDRMLFATLFETTDKFTSPGLRDIQKRRLLRSKR
jgi:hypothetical protein